MAALIKHVLSKNSPNKLFTEKICILCCRGYAKKHFKEKLRKVEMPACRKLQSTQDSVSAKGFLRCQKSYTPPQNVENSLERIVTNILGSISFQSISHSQKYQILSTCAGVFNHSVPNSILHQIVTYDDLKNFYLTPVDTVLPLERLKRVELPPNLHVQYEPHRFHPDEDIMFNGQTAFPKSNTLVTGIRTRRKFKGSIVTSPFEAFL